MLNPYLKKINIEIYGSILDTASAAKVILCYMCQDTYDITRDKFTSPYGVIFLILASKQ